MSAILVIVVFVAVNGVDDDFVSRVERTELTGAGKTIPRVERDDEGNVTCLYLNDMALSKDDFNSISRLVRLRSMALCKAQFDTENLKQLERLPNLQGLNLTNTEVKDDVIEVLIKLPALRSVCLGNVDVRPESIAKLKMHFREQNRQLGLGYTQRKP